MLVYHTSDQIISHPDTLHSREYLDFGRGFYVTTIREQALKYAARIVIRGGAPFLNIYDLQLDSAAHSHKLFEAYDREWLNYVSACRQGRKVQTYDVIEGGIADDRVFDTVDLYFSGILSETDALRRLVYIEPNSQICFYSQDVLDKCLSFVGSEEIQL